MIVGLPCAQIYGHLHIESSRIKLSQASNVNISLNIYAVLHAFAFKMRVTKGGNDADAPDVSTREIRNCLKSEVVVITPTIMGFSLINMELLLLSTYKSKFHRSKTLANLFTYFKYKAESVTFSTGFKTYVYVLPFSIAR